MKIALIDDESAIRETIRVVLDHYFDSVEIREASGVAEGVKLLTTYSPDLLFLDVEMGDGTGFDLLTRLPSLQCKIVFVTAHSDYAVKAFKFSAIDYILKPVNPEEIKKAVEKVINNSEVNFARLNSLHENWQQGYISRIVLTDLSGINIIELEDIIRCQAFGNYTHFYLKEGKEMVISTTLKHYSDLLADQGFFRVHQTHLINLRYLVKYTKAEGGEVIMKDGSTLPVSSRKREALIELLKKLQS